MRASDLFVKCLENEGVQFIFGIPGEENIDLVDSISRSSIRFILCRHEQGAAFMADTYGRLTGKPGVCLSTLGPGATNLVTGVANAHLDKVPVVAITGQASRDRLHKESHQNIDTLKLFSGITKYNAAVIVSEAIPEIIRKAFQASTSEQPGASHIQLPEDVAREEMGELSPLYIPEKVVYESVGKQIEESAKIINASLRPIILVGNGVIRSKAWDSVSRFVDTCNIPVVSTFMAKGVIPFKHPRNLFVVGGKPYPPGMRPLHAADLVIAIGFDLVEYDPITWNSDSKRKIINIHTSAAETDEHFPVEIDLVGDISVTVGRLTGLVKRRSDTSIHDGIREKRLAELNNSSDAVHRIPRGIMKVLTDDLPPDSTLISDVGIHKVWVARWYHPSTPNRTIIYNGFASMGGSLPAAVSAKLLRPDDNVVSVTGDGGFLMNLQELETASRLKLAFTIVVLNNGSYGLIKQKQEDSGYKPEYISFTNPDFKLLAHSFNANYFRCEGPEDFRKALMESLKSDRVCIIEVPSP
jgi:acetolactate synthase-1/2/3 large subunit